ncbi:MAG: SNF2-related protein [Victivallaceae bacterium]
MGQSFESRLIEASSPEVVKAAKQLLKSSKLACVYRDEKGCLHAVFEDKNGYSQVKVLPGEQNQASCSCSNKSGKLCEHSVAVIMYCGRFKEHEIAPIHEEKAKYAGLKYENIQELIEQESGNNEARLHIEVESAFPHVPSKWENAVLAVKFRTDKKEYIGNLNNIRQLYFGKSLAVSLKLSQFSLQDHQIIRFLSINSEPENSRLLLNSEQTAEFFHCLIGFDRFTREGRKLIIHREAAEPVILKRRSGDAIFLSPAIRIGGSILQVKSAKVITGRSGCWVGTQGEYWWVPATLDVGWLRNFFRSGEHQVGSKGGASILSEGHLPVPVIENSKAELKTKKCSIWLGGGFNQEKKFNLKLSFNYDGRIFDADQGRIALSGDCFWSRDEKIEKAIAEELKMFGFNRDDGDFQLDNMEAAGVFLDKVIPLWLRTRENFCLEGSLARLCHGGNGLPEVKIKCKLNKSVNDRYSLNYDLTGGGLELSWHNLLKESKAGRQYILASASCMVKMSSAFKEFIAAADSAAQKVDEKNALIEILRCSMHYWKYIGRNLPGVVPPELFADTVPADVNIPAVNENMFKGALRHYQDEGVGWMRQFTDSGFNVILADEMGLGKTIQTLALLASKLTTDKMPALIICPASLVENWKRECEKFVPSFKVAALAGNGRNEVWENASDYNLIIVSYATAGRDAVKTKSLKFSYLILDEAQHIKNPNTANAQNCKAINADHRLVLTGTPLENSSEDLWSIFDFLHPGLLDSFNGFKKYYNGIRDDKALQGDLAARVAPFIKRRTKANVCQELPPKQEQTLFCEMDVPQRKLYEHILQVGREQLASLPGSSKGKSNFEILTILLRLRQVCCHPNLLPDGIGAGVPSAKSELMKELVLQNIDSGHKMLFFSQFTSLLGIVRNWFDEEKISYEYLDGATKNRQQHVDNFNGNPDIPVFLLSLKAGGTGLNLTSADTVIIYDPWWNPAVELQATDRTHRIGQTNPVCSLKLVVKDSIEEKILSMQSKKQEIFDNIIENPASYGDKLSIDELRFLFQ